MITEIVEIEVKPGEEAAFEAGVVEAIPLFQTFKGCRGMELHRTIEKPSKYRLFVKWETLDDHWCISAARRISRNGGGWSAPTLHPRPPSNMEA